MKSKRKNVIGRAWERCRSFGNKYSSSSGTSSAAAADQALKKSKSWHCSTPTSSEDHNKGKNNPEKGCFSVYVGHQRQRFVIKTEFANHPLFKMLLEDAELEYGFSGEGPLLLPCDVDLFYKVLAEIIDSTGSEEISTPICRFGCNSTPLILFSPSRNRHSLNKGYGSYKLLTPISNA